MDEEASKKLRAAIARRDDRATQQAIEKSKQEAAEAKRRADKDAAKAKWTADIQLILAAVEAVNGQLSESNLKFLPPTIDVKPTALARMEIILVDIDAPQHRHRRLVLNVSGFGLVQPAGAVPHSLGDFKSFDVKETDKAHYERLLASFIDALFK